jgi:hypothetical protein
LKQSETNLKKNKITMINKLQLARGTNGCIKYSKNTPRAFDYHYSLTSPEAKENQLIITR